MADSPWYSPLTIDLIWHVLKRSLFHWFIAWIIPLSLIALGHSIHSPGVQGFSLFAAIIDIITVLYFVDDRIANGSPNPVNLAEEVIAITGGANGLGLVLAQMLGMKGAAVAILDVVEPAEPEIKGVTFIKCDASNPPDLVRAEQEIRKRLGAPATTVVNNAAVLHAAPLWDTPDADLARAVGVNTSSHFHAARVFLPNMLAANRGAVVTVSSVLGRLGCANLGAYTASKAALLAMHASLRADLRALSSPAARNIKTVLVVPGQLNTRMFGHVETPNGFLAPLVEPVELAREIVRYLEEGRSGEIYTPLYTRFIPWLDVLPAGVREVVRWASRMDAAMSAAVVNEAGDGVRRGGEKGER